MATTKAEMEAHQAQYDQLIRSARECLAERNWKSAIELAVSSLDYVDGMMRYEAKYEQAEFDRIEGIDIILEYSPLTMHKASLDALRVVLKRQRRIDREASADLSSELDEAFARLQTAYRVWDCLEQNGSISEIRVRELLPETARWSNILLRWKDMGIVQIGGSDGSYDFSTKLGELAWGKCPCCATILQRPKRELLNGVNCSGCEKHVQPVLISGAM